MDSRTRRLIQKKTQPWHLVSRKATKANKMANCITVGDCSDRGDAELQMV